MGYHRNYLALSCPDLRRNGMPVACSVAALRETGSPLRLTFCIGVRCDATTTGVLQRGRDQVNGDWTPTEAESYEAQMAMYQAMAMAQEETRRGQAQSNAFLARQASGGGAPMGRWLAVLTAAWLAKDVAANVFRARL